MLGRFFLGLWLYVQIILVESKRQVVWTRGHGFPAHRHPLFYSGFVHIPALTLRWSASLV